MNDTVPRRETAKPPPGVGPRHRGSPLWTKLGSVAVTANLAGLLVAIWTSRLIRAGLEDGLHETLILFVYYGSMLLIALVEAFFLDELVFDGAFRLTHLQGKSVAHARADEDVREIAATMQRSTMSFPFLVLGGLVVSYVLFNAVNRDFDEYYRQVGTYAADLRDGDEQTRLAAVAALSIRRRPEILPILERQLDRGDAVAHWSAWAIGRHTDLTRRKGLWKPLVAASRSDDPHLRREAIVALGRLQHRAMADQLHDAVRRDLENGRVDLRLLYGLGVVQVMESLPILESVLHRGSESEQRMAAWALAQHRDQRGGRAAVEILEGRLPTASLPLVCAIVHSLGILSDEQSNLALIDAYDRADPSERVTICPNIQLYMRPDGKDDRIDLLLPQRTLARKVIDSMGQMRATSPTIRSKVEPWLVDIIQTSPPEIREAAHSLLKGIRQGRDDREATSIEEAIERIR